MSRSRLVVIGDTLLDCDVEGTVDRLCPDAPVPVVDLRTQRPRPGGAGLAALLAARAGHQVVLVTALGTDAAARLLVDLLDAHVELVRMPLRGATVCKTRIRARGRSLLRVDSGNGRAGGAPPGDGVSRALGAAGAVLVSDYGRDVGADPTIRAALAELAGRVPVVWDPHPCGALPIPGCRLATPNEAEVTGAVPTAGTGATAAEALRERWKCDALVMTRGAQGALLATAQESRAVPVPDLPDVPVPPDRDTCGAGDAFAAAVTGALLERSSVSDAVPIAVRVASQFVADGGAASVEARPTGRPRIRPDRRSALELAAQVRHLGGRLVATGGCFDLLHPGHLTLLRRARALGDCLVVCLNSDESVRRRKGPGRPIVPATDRIALLQALEPVDAVTVFDEDTPLALLEILRPDVWVKGGDYAVADLPEAPLVARYGGQTVIIPVVEGYSTSRLVAAARGELVSHRKENP
ncbi:MAG: D-glycero-beta-D-manno-heptose 1-phosphate adenylyltransferase [Pseudonocardiaceae bacterium]